MSSFDEPTLSPPPARGQDAAVADPQRAGAPEPPGGDGAERYSQELLTLNFGPHHPATHGVLRLLTTLEGEVVRDIVPMIGYLHTGIEKTAEDKAYWKAITVVERMDYLAYFFNAMAPDTPCAHIPAARTIVRPGARPGTTAPLCRAKPKLAKVRPG